MDMLPDWEPPKIPEGFRKGPTKTPRAGDWVVDYYGKLVKVTKKDEPYWIEQHPTFIKIKGHKKKLKKKVKPKMAGKPKICICTVWRDNHPPKRNSFAIRVNKDCPNHGHMVCDEYEGDG